MTWLAYIDDLKIGEILTPDEALHMKASVAPWMSEAMRQYAHAGTPGNPKKDEHRQFSVSSLGDLVDGELGRREPPSGYFFKFVDLAFYMLSLPSVPRKLAQIVGGRAVRLQCYRKPTSSCFSHFWRWVSSPFLGRLPKRLWMSYSWLLPWVRYTSRTCGAPLTGW